MAQGGLRGRIAGYYAAEYAASSAFNGRMQRKHMKSALLSVAWNADNWTFDALKAHYHTLVRYLNLQDQGMVLGRGCGTPSMTRGSIYPEQARQLGQNL